MPHDPPTPGPALDDLAHAIDVVAIGVIIQGLEGQIRYANQTALDMLGFAPGGLVGKSSHESFYDVLGGDGAALPPDQRPAAVVERTGEPVRDKIVGVVTPKGHRVWLAVTGHPRHDAHGALKDVVLTMMDVSEERARLQRLESSLRNQQIALTHTQQALDDAVAQRQAAEAERASSERLYRSVIGAMAEGVTIHASDGTIMAANRAACRVLGLTLEQLQGVAAVDPQWDLVDTHGVPFPPDSIPVEITGTTGTPCERFIVGVRRSDGLAWLSVNTVPLERNPGEARWPVVATFIDVTRERQSTQALKANREHFQRVTEAVPGLLFQATGMAGEPLDVRFLSARSRDLLGVEPDDYTGAVRVIVQGCHPDHVDQVRNLLLQTEAVPRQLEFRHRVHPDGPWRWLRVEASRERRERGVLWTGVLLDVTEQHDLAERLQHAQRREAMGDVAAGIAHNFNNMLAVILPTLDEVLPRTTGATHAELLQANTAARSAADLVKQLVAITRREPHDLLEPVDLAVVTDEVLNLCKRLFDRGIHLERRGPPSGAWVTGRRSELHQVLLNLAINARDAIVQRTSASLTLTVRLSDALVEVQVQDNGIGMPPETVARLGEPFFTTKAPGHGTGLGLATAFATVQHLGGSLTCESELGTGTTFTLRLPRSQAAPGPSPEGAPEPNTSGLLDRRVLLVDDEALVRETLARLLRRRGLIVVDEDSGRSALRRLETQTFDVVICDLSMPEMPGHLVLQTIAERYPDLPVIMLSGFVSQAVDLTAAAAVLCKPVDAATLLDAVREALAR